MWLPRPIYEAIPYASAAAGALLIGVAWYTDYAPRGFALAVGGLLGIAGLVLWMKRRDYRSTQGDYNPRALDE
jgi:hypothetical protein